MHIVNARFLFHILLTCFSTVAAIINGYSSQSNGCNSPYKIKKGDNWYDLTARCCSAGQSYVELMDANGKKHTGLIENETVCLDICWPWICLEDRNKTTTVSHTEEPVTQVSHKKPEPVGSLSTSVITVICCCAITFAVAVVALFSYLAHKKKNLRLRSLDVPAHLRFISQSSFKNVLARYEISKASLNYGGSVIGVGHFGKVYKGRLSETAGVNPDDLPLTRDVAVKALHHKNNLNHQQDFFTEIEVGIRVGRHLNIVNLLGVVLKDDLLIVMEYCALGSLKDFLRRQKQLLCITADAVPFNRIPVSTPREISYVDLLNFCYQLSRGMEHIASCGIIHRDLAARNVLVDGNLVVKISDFGMARERNVYVLRRDDIPLPVRWMAPESIKEAKYTTKSDVWSFGVVFWEIFSWSDTPYAEITLDGKPHNMTTFLKNMADGVRLKKPELCPDEMFDIAQSCWTWNCADRPSFSLLTKLLSACLPQQVQEHYVVFDVENSNFNTELNVVYGLKLKSSVSSLPEAYLTDNV